MSYTYAQLEAIWLQAAAGTQYDTQTWAALMAAIAMAESSGNPDAQNDTDNNGTQTSWGLWQISNGTHSSVSPTWNNPITNAQLAIQKLETQGLSAWGTYDSGAYLQYLSNSTAPNSAGISTTGGSGTNASLTSSPLSLVTNPVGTVISGIVSAIGAGSVKDLLIRGGLVILGSVLIIVGIILLAGKGTEKLAVSVAAPEVGAAGKVAENASES